MLATYASSREVTRGIAELVRPPRRMKPSEAAAKWLHNDKGPWSPHLAPMMVEPLDELASRHYTGIVFVGPQRTGKTFGLIDAGITYIVTCAPGDTLVVQMSQDVARDFSRMEIDRVIRHSPELAARLSPRARDDNTYDKFFRSGIALKLGWPALSQVSGKTLKYVFLTDYDRPENRDDVGGEGPLWDLAHKRVQTYMSRGKCLAESSPGDPYEDPQWRARSPHEAPPARGILELYNRGTRARWYWPCMHCGEYWEPKPGLAPFAVPELDEVKELVLLEDPSTLAARFAKAICPHCGAAHEMDQRPEMNARGRWVHEGQVIAADGTVSGERRDTPFVSYWMGGAAAPFQRWDGLLYNYFQGVQTYVKTGDEGPLQTTTSSDQGAAYLPQAMGKRRGTEELTQRLEESEKGVVPADVRFLTAAVDVQAHRFVVEVFGWGVGLQSWLVDRFSITASNRPEGEKFAAVDPAAYVEDWMVLVDQVVERKYPVSGLELELGSLLTFVDSGGREGVTDKAYEFWRAMNAKGLGKKVRLIKGVGNINAPRVQETWPDARARKDRKAGRGDVPVWLLNVNVIKDGVHGDLDRKEVGPGYVHLPTWVDDEFFKELVAEVRTVKGWVREHSIPNEAFDLHTYNRGACIVLQAEAINWEKPPAWAMPLAERPARAEARAEAKKERKSKPRRNWVTQW